MSIPKRALAIALNLLIVFAIGAFRQVKTQPQSGAPGGGAFSRKSNRIRLVAAVNKDAKTGTLMLSWSLRNISQTAIHFQDNNLFRDYKITVMDRLGKTVQLTRKGQGELTGSYFISHREAFDLRPGEEKTKEIEIAIYYEVKPGGVYTIAVERQIKTEDGKGMEKSESKAIKFRL
jgi:hypothetical protein